MQTKIFAHYLPQFHQIKENDEWWGIGFTEWDNVKSAKKYNRNQTQPRIPYNNNYYDLSKKENIIWQCQIAKEFRINGFCIYHYYSKGQKLLEKPAELILENKDIEIEYFFSWANHHWQRTWAEFSWEMLREQEYGNEIDIYQHFKYLLPFFNDKRYYKINNKPVFLLYQNIEKKILEKYVEIFDREAKSNGFNGIYWIGTLKKETDYFSVNLDKYYRYEADYTKFSLKGIDGFIFNCKRKCSVLLNKTGIYKKPYSINYQRLSNSIIKSSTSTPNYILGVISGWDNTPRHKSRGSFFIKSNPNNFKKLFTNQYLLSKRNNSPFLLINAWNEWGEGAYLEPDNCFKYEYLNIIKNVVEN